METVKIQQEADYKYRAIYDSTPWGKPSWQAIKCMSIGLMLYIVAVFALYGDAGYITGLYACAATCIFFFGVTKWKLDALGVGYALGGAILFLYQLWVDLPLIAHDIKDIVFELSNH